MAIEQGGMTYKGSGVNHEGLDEYKVEAQQAGKETSNNLQRLGFKALEWTRGESVFVIETPSAYLGQVIEGLGTKSLVAEAMCEIAQKMEEYAGLSLFDNIGQSNVAVAVNDLITLGLTPLVYCQYLAVQNDSWFNDQRRRQGLINGTKKACDLAGCIWGGGETPALNGIILPGVSDLAGGTFGIIAPKTRIINPERISAGDAIVLVESSGIHDNGLSLARRIAAILPDGYLTKLSDGRTYGETLLDPTHIYVRLVQEVMQAGVDIHYAVNITGHGWRKLMRARQPFRYIIEQLPTQKPVFQFMQEQGEITDYNMFHDLNMGAGFAFYTTYADAVEIVKISNTLGMRAFIAGSIQEGEKQVIIPQKDIVFTDESMKLR